MPAWPSTLPSPKVEGYATAPDAAFIRTDMEAGPARQRQRYSVTPNSVSLNWLFTAAEMLIFRAFYRDDLSLGTGWFDVDLDIGDGFQSYEARFVAAPRSSKVSCFWLVSATLEVRNGG